MLGGMVEVEKWVQGLKSDPDSYLGTISVILKEAFWWGWKIGTLIWDPWSQAVTLGQAG